MSVSEKRRCSGCGTVLPVSARRDRVYCTPACRARAHAARRRVEVRSEREQMLDALAARLDEQMDERVLLARVVAAANTTGGWRAAAWLLRNVHGVGAPAVAEQSERPPPNPVFVELDELAARRGRTLGR